MKDPNIDFDKDRYDSFNPGKEQTDKRMKRLSELEFNDIKNFTYTCSFKIYQETTFDNIKSAACNFWQISNPDDYVITDEYFNVMSTYKDTVCNFFDETAGYKPLNENVFASVFLMKIDE